MRPTAVFAPKSPLAMLMIISLCLGAASCARAQPPPGRVAAAEPTEGLQAFRSDEELRNYLRAHFQRMPPPPPMEPSPPQASADAAGAPPPMTSAAPPPPAAQSEAMGRAAQPGAISGVRGADGSITNNQVQGVDEGDIVKLRGDLLVILRRGRLFTVSIAGGTMRPVSQLDVTPPGAQATTSDWYDEMLISGDRVIVIGYSYRRRGTDIYRFRIDRSGKLSFEDAYQLRSSDYYSDRNYASRMIGNQLILYTPLPIAWQGDDPLQSLPAIRRWRSDDDQDGYRRIAEAGSVYIPGRLFYAGDARVTTFHTVTRCDVTAPVLDCHATSVLGNESRSFYVSASAVYVWTSAVLSGRTRDHDAGSLIYRMPLSLRGRPAAVAARGAPIDQFAFREDTDTGMLNVLVRSEGGGDAMWSAEFTPGRLSLLRFPISAFGKGDAEVGHGFYRFLPPASQPYALHDRYVGPYLLYGAATTDYGDQRQDGQGGITAVPVAGGPITNLKLASGVDRIEALGGDAVAVGSTDQDVIFTTIELTGGGRAPTIGDRYVRRDASEGETRSHGFFYHPDSDSPDGQDGILGLPIAKRASPAYRSLFTSSASMVYLRRADRRLSPMGELEAADTGIVDDQCRASCVDWYGNARPIFVGDRVFALLGYELVEGGVSGASIRETGRISFAPEPNGPPPAEE